MNEDQKLMLYSAALIDIVGESGVLMDEASKHHYGKDFTQKFEPKPIAIVFPKSESEVISIVNWANEYSVPLVPSGGRTGYSGGAVAKDNEVVVSFDRFNRITKFSEADRQVTCEPGVTTKCIQDFAAEKNLMYPVDFASSGSSQIGGNVATNAGGIKVIRYGLTRDWVSGLRVVTGEGKLLQLNNGLVKNACGYDLRHLFIGSEGTLGFITEVTLNLSKRTDHSKVVLLSVPENSRFVDILNEYDRLVSVTAFEFFSELALGYVLLASNLSRPFSKATPYYVLIEYESNEHSDEVVLDITEKLITKQFVADALVSASMTQAEKLWCYRESISMSLLKFTPYKYDVSVRPSDIESFISESEALFEDIYPDFEVVWFGHVGDGNLHLNILKPGHLNKDTFFDFCERTSDRVFGLIEKYRGAISAEHGVGLLKTNFLHYTKSQAEIDYMRSIKKIFDPKGIMNPGKLFL